ADAVDARAEELARLLSREQGKPLNGPNARFEIGACSAWLRTNAALQLEPEVLVDDGETHAELHYRAAGVVGAIGPWNWPLMIAVWQLAPALRMGNTVVLKPSEYTPLSVLALVDVLNEALPADVLIAVSGGREVGARLASHPDIDKVMFTGSTATGKKIIESSAGNLARLTLELGGNDAGIILPGTDAKAIAQDLFWGAFINTGQTCAALKRLYVHDSVYDEVVEALAAVARATPMGNGLDEENVLGPLQNKQQFDIVNRLVEDAKAHGGRIVTGGSPATELGELFYPITLVADVSDGVALVDEEQFGPALPIIRYTEVEDAITSANRLDVGLGGSVWGPDRDAALAVANRMQSGTVWINSHGGVHPMIPFGGVKGSGYGVEFGVEGLKAVSVHRVING
ncbi:MAG: aldehyde dehydrogenase family protein, partial [Actinobacteria bacterium]|nr:aldehyde dehydrogenase family protein [Actinomycetota bacterium]